MASQSDIVTKVHKSKRILQINLETEEEYYEVQNESVDLIELLDSETNESHTEVKEKEKVNETLFLEKTQSLSKPTPIKSYQSKDNSSQSLFLDKTQSLPKTTPIKAYQSKDNSNQTLFLEKTKSLPKTFQSNLGDSFLDETECWSQSFCNETSESASLDNSEILTFFQNKTQSLTRSHSNGTPGLSPVSSFLDDTVTLSGNKNVQHNIASIGSYLTSTPARSRRLVQEDPSCSESFNNNACPKSPILEYSINSSHPSEAHTAECRPSTSREVQNLSLDKSCRASRGFSSSSKHGSLDGNIKMTSQEMSLAPVYGEMSSQVGQIIDEEKFASCPICFKILLKDDLLVHASGCEGEEDGFVGMSSGFLCGYCGVHIKDEDEEKGEHLLMCKAVMTKKKAEEERQGRKKTLRKGSIQSHKNVTDKRKEKETETVGRSNLKRSAALVETKTVGRSNLKRSAALVETKTVGLSNLKRSAALVETKTVGRSNLKRSAALVETKTVGRSNLKRSAALVETKTVGRSNLKRSAALVETKTVGQSNLKRSAALVESKTVGRSNLKRSAALVESKTVGRSNLKRSVAFVESKTVGRSNLKRSAALVSGMRPVHKQKKCNPPTSNATCANPPTSNVKCTNPPTSNVKCTNPPTSNARCTNPLTSNTTCTIADVCIPSTSKSLSTNHSETSRLVNRNLRGNPRLRENIHRENSNIMNLATDRRNSSCRNLTAPRPNGKARKKARVICSACPLCLKHWMMEELEVHASGCRGGDQEIILDGTHDEMTDGEEGNERFLCGYCSTSVQVGEEDKENHIIPCRKKMAMKKWQEAAQEKKNALRSREKKEV